MHLNAKLLAFAPDAEKIFMRVNSIFTVKAAGTAASLFGKEITMSQLR